MSYIKTIDLDKEQEISDRTISTSMRICSMDLNRTNGDIFFLESITNLSVVKGYLGKLSQSGSMTEIKDFIYSSGKLYLPTDVKFDPIRNKIWVADSANHRIIKIDASTGFSDLTIEGKQLFPCVLSIDLNTGNIFSLGYDDLETCSVIHFDYLGNELASFKLDRAFAGNGFCVYEGGENFFVADLFHKAERVDVKNSTAIGFGTLAGNPKYITTNGMSGISCVVYDGIDIIEGRDFDGEVICQINREGTSNFKPIASDFEGAFWIISYLSDLDKYIIEKIRFDVENETFDVIASSELLDDVSKGVVMNKNRRLYVLSGNGTLLFVMDYEGKLIETVDLSTYGSFDIIKEDTFGAAIWLAIKGATTIVRIDEGGNVGEYDTGTILTYSISPCHKNISFDFLYLVGEDTSTNEVKAMQLSYSGGPSFTVNSSIVIPGFEYRFADYDFFNDKLWMTTDKYVYYIESWDTTPVLKSVNLDVWLTISDFQYFNTIGDKCISPPERPKSDSMTFDDDRNRLWYVNGTKVCMVDIDTKEVCTMGIGVGFEATRSIAIDADSGNALVSAYETSSKIWKIVEIFKDNNEIIGVCVLPDVPMLESSSTSSESVLNSSTSSSSHSSESVGNISSSSSSLLDNLCDPQPHVVHAWTRTIPIPSDDYISDGQNYVHSCSLQNVYGWNSDNCILYGYVCVYFTPLGPKIQIGLYSDYGLVGLVALMYYHYIGGGPVTLPFDPAYSTISGSVTFTYPPTNEPRIHLFELRQS